MIRFENVSLRYGEHSVIQDLSHQFPEKGIVALMGASGLGKTTLLRLLCGLEKPSGGSVSNSYKKTAVSFQEPRLIPWMNCEENIKIVLSKGKKDSVCIPDLLARVGLLSCEKLLPDELSGGMQQRVSLLRALVCEPDLLLLDEPFSGLDEETKHLIYPLIQTANPNGLTVMITHSVAEAQALGAEILLLDGAPVTALKRA